MSHNFGIIGVAGYIAPRHLKAIRDTGNTVVAALDPHDSVGILDTYFPQCKFFTEFERFDRHVDKLRRAQSTKRIEYVSICSPNYLHDAHIRFALRSGAHAICEKPLVLNPWNIDALGEIERESGKRIFTVLQLRVHPVLRELHKKLQTTNPSKKHEVTLTYITSRGSWYLSSWKGSLEKSGGLATNIGIHFFDLLIWLFGKAERSEVHLKTSSTTAGFLELEKARVTWFLSIDERHLPVEVRNKGQRTYRSLLLDNKEVEFSEGFTDLHTDVYKDILEGQGFGLNDALPSIQIAHDIRVAEISARSSTAHPLTQSLRNS